jgi:pyruvate/2-oxoglutarate/acetoin dehydrogenase E1 component
VPDGEHVDKLGTAKIVREGKDATLVALAAMVPRALEAAERLAATDGISVEVIDVRSLCRWTRRRSSVRSSRRPGFSPSRRTRGC